MASSISTSGIASLIPKRSLLDMARHHVDSIATATTILGIGSSSVTPARPSSYSGTTVRHGRGLNHYTKWIRSTILVTVVVVYVAMPIGIIFGFFRSSEWVSLAKSHSRVWPVAMTAGAAMVISTSFHFTKRHLFVSPLILLVWLSLFKYIADHGALPKYPPPFPHSNNRNLLNGKVCVVTGGNTGIGLATAELLVRHGAAQVILTCRTMAKCQPALQHLQQQAATTTNTVVSAHPLELTNLTSAYQLTQELTSQYSAIHYLFNNAGSTPIHNLTVDGLEDGFGGMHLGHVAVTLGLLPLLQRAGEETTTAQARIIFVSSEMAVASAVGVFGFEPFGVDFDQGTGEGDLRGEMTRADGTAFRDLQAYGRAKLCNVLTALELNRRLVTNQQANVRVHAIHPGAVLTRTARHAVSDLFRVWWLPGLAALVNQIYLPWLWRTPEQAAQALLFAALANHPEPLATGGQYLDAMCRPFWTSSNNVTKNPSVIRQQIGKESITFYNDPVQALLLADEKWSKRLWEVNLSLLRNSPARDLVNFAP